MRGIGTLCVVNSIRVSSARRRRAPRGVLPSDTSMRSGKAKNETAHVLAGSDGYVGPGMGHRRSARIAADAVVLAPGPLLWCLGITPG